MGHMTTPARMEDVPSAVPCHHLGFVVEKVYISAVVHCFKDDSSEESTEDPIVDVGVSVVGPGNGKGRQPTRRPRNMNTSRNQTMMNYTRRGSGGSAGGSGGCPGSLEDCIAACPSTVRVFKVCTANCERRCSKK